MTRTICSHNGTLSNIEIDLQHSTLEIFHGGRLTFTYYYHDVDSDAVFAGMSPATNPNLQYVVKLVQGEPVDLSENEWQEQWTRFPQVIPLDI